LVESDIRFMNVPMNVPLDQSQLSKLNDTQCNSVEYSHGFTHFVIRVTYVVTLIARDLMPEWLTNPACTGYSVYFRFGLVRSDWSSGFVRFDTIPGTESKSRSDLGLSACSQ